MSDRLARLLAEPRCLLADGAMGTNLFLGLEAHRHPVVCRLS